ncbi:hypothetical protein [Negadavirga shengliensis]|uniref:Uncharacterized protein n=1 Tax=Negadavirga shengliensis TaxID=1389218 RepID=A0ABV9SVK1_9BACT
MRRTLGKVYRKNRSMFWIVCWVLPLVPAKVWSQTGDTTDNGQKQEVYDFILLNAKFNDRFTFMGRDFGQTIPTLSTDVMYYFHTGLYFNVSAFRFLEPEIPYQYALSLGYQTDLSAKTDLNVSYSQFLVSGSSEVTGIQNMGFLQGTFGLDWDYLYSTLQLQGLFNDKTDVFISSQHSRYFEFDQRLFKTITVSFEPAFSFMWGTSRFYHLGGFGENLLDAASELENLRFLTWEIMLPLNLEWNGWGMEFQYRYVHPVNTPEFDESGGRFIFGGQLTYSLPIKKMR